MVVLQIRPQLPDEEHLRHENEGDDGGQQQRAIGCQILIVRLGMMPEHVPFSSQSHGFILS